MWNEQCRLCSWGGRNLSKPSCLGDLDGDSFVAVNDVDSAYSVWRQLRVVVVNLNI